MLQTIISASAVFISTSIDYLLIITIVFAQAKTKKSAAHIVGGQYLGTAILVTVSLIAAFVLHFIPQEWITGLLGLVPITLGIWAAFKKGENEEDEAQEVVEKLEARKSTLLFWTITMITIASGGDNLGIYIPYFSAMPAERIAAALVIFALGTLLVCYIGFKLSSVPLIAKTLEKYERVIVPIVYIGLGIYIMAESGTFAKLMQLIGL